MIDASTINHWVKNKISGKVWSYVLWGSQDGDKSSTMVKLLGDIKVSSLENTSSCTVPLSLCTERQSLGYPLLSPDILLARGSHNDKRLPREVGKGRQSNM